MDNDSFDEAEFSLNMAKGESPLPKAEEIASLPSASCNRRSAPLVYRTGWNQSAEEEPDITTVDWAGAPVLADGRPLHIRSECEPSTITVTVFVAPETPRSEDDLRIVDIVDITSEFSGDGYNVTLTSMGEAIDLSEATHATIQGSWRTQDGTHSASWLVRLL